MSKKTLIKPASQSTLGQTHKIVDSDSKAQIKSAESDAETKIASTVNYAENALQQSTKDENGLEYKLLNKLYLLLGKEGFKELVESYIARAKKYIQSAWQHIEDGNMEQLYFVAHTFKGSSANIGASSLAALSASLEALAQQNKPIAELSEQLTLITEQFANIENLLLENLSLNASDSN